MKFSLIAVPLVVWLTIPCVSIAQTPTASTAPSASDQTQPTEREKALLEEIRKLEDRVKTIEQQNPPLPGQAPAAACDSKTLASGGSGQAAAEDERSSYGTLDASGQGFLVARTPRAALWIGGYALVRFIDQTPAQQTFTDHLGNVNIIDPRNDIQFHRAMINFRGYLGSPKLKSMEPMFGTGLRTCRTLGVSPVGESPS